MGYYVRTIGTDLLVSRERFADAERALTARAEKETAQSPSSGWRHVLAARERAEREGAPALPAMVGAVGFDRYVHDDGALEVMAYDDKSWLEEEFAEELAPFAVPGGYLEWEGEDGALWRWDFDGDGMSVRYGDIVWR